MSVNARTRGCFVVFEGIDGSGKSTQCARLARWLERTQALDVVQTREPTGGPHGRRIRAMARSGERVAPQEELRWFVEDRREHVRDTIAPALAAGRTVLCDRYLLSSVAYQGARGLDPWEILARHERDPAFAKPDLVLLFVLPVEQALERARSRGGPAEPAFEEQQFLERVEAIFEQVAAARPDEIVRIDASGSEQEVEQRVRAAWSAFAERRRRAGDPAPAAAPRPRRSGR